MALATHDEDTDDVTAQPYSEEDWDDLEEDRSDSEEDEDDSEEEEGDSEEDGGDDTLGIKGCIIGHRAFVPRMKKKKHDIELEQGPAETYTKKVAGKALRKFAARLRPLTRTMEGLFRAVLPEEYGKYRAVYDEIYEENERDPIDEAFGIWTSRSLVMNANTNNHKDLEDVCRGWCAIVVLGKFEGGDACFPELGVKIDCPPGTYRQ